MVCFLSSWRAGQVRVFLFGFVCLFGCLVWFIFCGLFFFWVGKGLALKSPYETFPAIVFFRTKSFSTAVHSSILAVFIIHMELFFHPKIHKHCRELVVLVQAGLMTHFLRSFTCLVIFSFSHDVCWLSYSQTLTTVRISCARVLKSPLFLALHEKVSVTKHFLCLFTGVLEL